MAEAVEQKNEYTLCYFNVPGRGEIVRNMFKYGGVEFTDTRVSFGEWKELKPTTVWGSMPYLTVAGQDLPLTQTRAIARFVAKKVGLYPNDVEMACHADALFDVCEDIGVNVNDTGKGLDKEAKIAARQKVRDEYDPKNKGGDFMGLMGKLDDFLGRDCFAGDYALGGTISLGDFAVYQYMANITSGFYDGCDEKLLVPFENIKKVMAQMQPVIDGLNTKYKLVYFNLPGRGEVIRTMFKLKNVPFVDERIEFKEWPQKKSDTVWGSLPYLEIAGRDTPLTQTRAISRYVGKVTGFYPEDDTMACHADAVFDVMEEAFVTANATGKGLDKEAKIAARQKVMSDYDPKNKNNKDFMGLLGKLDDFLGNKDFDGDWALGKEMTIADMAIQQYIANATGGFLDGINDSILTSFPNIQKVMTQMKPVMDGLA